MKLNALDYLGISEYFSDEDPSFEVESSEVDKEA